MPAPPCGRPLFRCRPRPPWPCGLHMQSFSDLLDICHAPAGLEASLLAMAAPQWEVRNGAMLCYTSLLVRMLGFRNTASQVSVSLTLHEELLSMTSCSGKVPCGEHEGVAEVKPPAHPHAGLPSTSLHIRASLQAGLGGPPCSSYHDASPAFYLQYPPQDRAAKRAMSVADFFAQYPALHPFLLSQLGLATEQLESGRGRAMHPSLFPVLALLSRLR